jgi:hypothetical protein
MEAANASVVDTAASAACFNVSTELHGGRLTHISSPNPTHVLQAISERLLKVENTIIGDFFEFLHKQVRKNFRHVNNIHQKRRDTDKLSILVCFRCRFFHGEQVIAYTSRQIGESREVKRIGTSPSTVSGVHIVVLLRRGLPFLAQKSAIRGGNVANALDVSSNRVGECLQVRKEVTGGAFTRRTGELMAPLWDRSIF